MPYIMIDGFDDRLNIVNGYHYDEAWDGWGLYPENIWDGEYSLFPFSHGNLPIGRYGGYAFGPSYAARYEGNWSEITVVADDYFNDFVVGIACNSAYAFSIRPTRGSTKILEVESGAFGQVEVSRRISGTVVARSQLPNLMTMWGWHYYEIAVHVDGIEAGNDTIVVKVDGQVVINESGLDFAGGYGPPNKIDIPNSAANIDDIYVKIGDTDLIGEARVLALFPSKPGSYSDFTPAGEDENYATVDDFLQDLDETYNEGSDDEAKDSFVMDDLSDQVSAGTIHALVGRILCKQDVGESNELIPFVVVDGTIYYGTAQVPVAGAGEMDYRYIQEIWETNPATSNPWTVEEIDDVEFGYEIHRTGVTANVGTLTLTGQTGGIS